MSTVLLIEDDRFLIEDLKTFIEFEGHTCDAFPGPDEVIENLDHLAKYDVIVLDIMMARGAYLPDEDSSLETGELLYQRIRAKYRDIRFLIISAKNFDEMNIDFTKEENVVTIAKPFSSTASELISRL
jgi:CheY-like chemotaxis protein